MSEINSEGPVEVLHRFYYWLDERRYEDMATLMCEEGVWLRQGRELRGPRQLLEALRLRAGTVRVRHVMTNGFAQLDSHGVAWVQLYQTVYKHAGCAADAVPTIPGPTSVSAVTARLHRSSEGAWRIAHLQSRKQFNFGPVG